MVIIALDPGRNLGYALLDEAGTLLDSGIVAAETLSAATLAGLDLRSAGVIVVGDGTGSADLQRRLAAQGLTFEVVDERGTSLEGRDLYFRHHPPLGLWRLVPRGLRSPPRPVDDFAAYAIGLRYLARRV